MSKISVDKWNVRLFFYTYICPNFYELYNDRYETWQLPVLHHHCDLVDVLDLISVAKFFMNNDERGLFWQLWQTRFSLFIKFSNSTKYNF